MKRKEMLDLIVEQILAIPPYAELTDYYSSADKILSILEAKGMRPPMYLSIDDTNQHITENGDLFAGQVVEVYEWEPEDD